MAVKRKLDFSAAIKELEKRKSDLPKTVANTAVNFYVNNFNKAEWEGVKWKEVKRREKGGDNSDAKRGILKGKTRSLYLALKKSVRSANWKGVRFGIDLSYAAVHNEGLKAGRGKGFIMPKRKFIGNNMLLNKKLDKLIFTSIKSIFAK